MKTDLATPPTTKPDASTATTSSMVTTKRKKLKDRLLFGRNEQIRRLERQFSAVREKHYCVALLKGERGSGKTRIVKEYADFVEDEQTIFINISISQKNYQIDHFIKKAVFSILSILAESSAQDRSKLLNRIWSTINQQKMGWLFQPSHFDLNEALDSTAPQSDQNEHQSTKRSHTGKNSNIPQPFQHTTPRKIIRRDAFVAQLKRVFIEISRTIAEEDYRLICHINHLELAHFDCLDFLTDCFLKQSLQAVHLVCNSSNFSDRSIQYFIKDLRSYNTNLRNIGLFQTIHIPPLTQNNTQRLIEQELSPASFNTAHLSQIIYEKSKGNPGKTRFIIEILKELKLLQYSPNTGTWLGQLEKISRQKILSNYYNHTNQLIERSYCTKKILIYAACYREAFNADILRLIMPGELIQQVDSTINLGLNYSIIQPHSTLSNYYHFYNLDIVDSVLSLENANSLNITYKKILTKLVEHFPAKYPFNKPITLFQLADCINALTPIAVKYNDKLIYQKIIINALAGHKAFSLNNVNLASRHFKIAIDHIGPNFWDRYHSICFFCYYHWINCLYLREDYPRCDEEIETCLRQPLTEIERTKITILKIYCLKATARNDLAIYESKQALKPLGVRTPQKPSLLHVFYRYLQAKIICTLKLDQNNKRTTEKTILIHKLCELLAHSAYFENLIETHYFGLRMVQLTAKYGTTPFTTIGAQYVGLLDFIMFGQHHTLEQAYLRQSKLNTNYCNNQLLSEIFYYGMQGPWRFPLQTCISKLLEAYKAGIRVGEDETSGNCSCFYFSFATLQGKDYPALLKQFHELLPQIEAPKYSSSYYCNLMLAQAVENGVTLDHDPRELRGKWFDDMIHQEIIRHGDYIGKFCYHSILTYLNLMYDNWKEGEINFKLGNASLPGVFGLFSIVIFRFFGEMNFLNGLHKEPSRWRLINNLPRLFASVLYFSRVNKKQPQNFGSFYYLLKGFTFYTYGLRRKKALQDINRGIKLAKREGFINYAGLGSEMKYKLILSKRRPTVITALKHAIKHYRANGHHAKRKDIEKLIHATSIDNTVPLNRT